MQCPRCGSNVADDLNYCTECGAPLNHVPVQEPYSDPGGESYGGPAGEPYGDPGGELYGMPEKKKTNVALIIVIAVVAILAVFITAAFIIIRNVANSYKETVNSMRYELDPSEMPDIDVPDVPDIDSLNEAAKQIEDLDLGIDNGSDIRTPDDLDVTDYSYTTVFRDGDEITVIPNGGLSGSTVLYGGKDLDGFLDYIDSTVLEEGRTINRTMFYDLLAIMNVDEDLTPRFEDIEKNMIMALAVANDFHNADVTINSCELDANNAAEYRLDVTAYGTDDEWIVNFGDRTFYMHDGDTEYSSGMFDDQNLAVWGVAIEEYFDYR